MFFRTVLATLVALIIFVTISLLLLFGIAGMLSSQEQVTIKENSVLKIRLDRPIEERSIDDPLAELFPGDNTNIGLLDLKKAIKAAKDDENIKGILIELKWVVAGYASLEEIRNDLQDFRSSGKFVISYGDYLNEKDYYLASVADEIYIHPEGWMELNGLASNMTFFKGTLDKLEIEPQIFKVGDYKSAAEPITRKDMSDENREQILSFLNSIYDNYLENVAESRTIEIDQLRNISDSMLVRNVKDALRLGLVDRLAYYDEVLDDIKERLELEKDDKLSLVSVGKYISYLQSQKQKTSKNRIAVVVASGEITLGEGEENNVGAEKFAKIINKARKDDKVKAMVIRINSPGGYFIASDIIWREIKLASEKMPVIASMSDVAASGGYYLAMACDTIVAQPTTITGSIGVIRMWFNFKDFMSNKLGVTFDVAKTGKFSNIYSLSHPLTEYEKEIFQKDTEDAYETFTEKAAQGRGMTIEDLKKVASGRVWSGKEAFENGLVDELGGIDRSVEIAAEAAGIGDDYKINYYPRQKTLVEQIMSELSGGMESTFLKLKYGELAPYIEKLKDLEKTKGVLTRLPFDIEIH
ncbi:MAG: signal peptide peptidase SppA [Bacteroidetes bacterium]|nr:signal peptide peptidase SppA [Bacteroidota bacterium]